MKTPTKHEYHYPSAKCGCWTPEDKGKTETCSHCDATYLPEETKLFPNFRCYDCGCAWSVK